MSKRTDLVFTLLQVITVVIALLGLLAAIYLGMFGAAFCLFAIAEPDYAALVYAVIGLITVAAVSVLSLVALYSFFMLCRRLKRETAFTPANGKAMHRIALCCGCSSAGLFIALILAFFLMDGIALGFVEVMLLLTAVYLCVALLAYALELLVHRATALQQENDLTI